MYGFLIIIFYLVIGGFYEDGEVIVDEVRVLRGNFFQVVVFGCDFFIFIECLSDIFYWIFKVYS